MARYASPLNNGKSGVEGETRLLGKLLSGSGVLGSADLAVTAQTTPDMTVKVAAGDAAIFSGATLYHGWSTANETVTINSNTSGSAKTDAVVAYIDPAAASATENNPNGTVFLGVRGASGAPTNTEISTAIGSKPYLVLATVVVGNGVTSINSGNITDVRTVSGNKGRFVSRQATSSSYDFNNSGFTGGWGSNTSLRSIVGNTAVRALIYVEFATTGPAPAGKASMAKSGIFSGLSPNGFTADARAQVLSTQVTNQPATGTFAVELDALQRLDVFIDSAGGGIFNYRMQVLGWWEP